MLNNFIGEFLVLQGAAIANFKWAIFAAIGVILSAVYMLWLYQRAFLGRASEDLTHHMFDLNGREWVALLPMVAMMFWMGCFPQSFVPPISAQNTSILEQSKVGVDVRVQNMIAPGTAYDR
jgi:NADH-quinone oxidoreductase subunit M